MEKHIESIMSTSASIEKSIAGVLHALPFAVVMELARRYGKKPVMRDVFRAEFKARRA